MAASKTAPLRAEDLPVLDGEDAWTEAEIAEVKAELQEDVRHLTSELDAVAADLEVLMRDSGDGAGDDQADVGTANFERDHEISLARKSNEILQQNEAALQRLEDGTYGVCESCSGPVGKLRLQAFPRATLCMACKQKQERR